MTNLVTVRIVHHPGWLVRTAWKTPEHLGSTCLTAVEYDILGHAGIGESHLRNDLTKLLHKVAGGDAQAYTEFYEEVRPLIRAVLHQTLFKDDLDAAEQEICVSVWQDAVKFDRTRGSAKTWIAILTRSRAMDFARASASRRRTDKLAGVERPHMDEQTPSANFAKEELRDSMRAHVDALPEPQRTLVELNFFVGLSQKQISESLDMPLGTVKSRIRSAFQTLAEVMPPPATE